MLEMPSEIDDVGVGASPSISTSAKKPQGILRVSKHGGKPKQPVPVSQSTITGKMNEKLKKKLSQKKMDITEGTSDLSSDEDRSRSSSDHSMNSAQSGYWGSSSHSSDDMHRALHDSSDDNSSQSSENSFAMEEVSDPLEMPKQYTPVEDPLETAGDDNLDRRKPIERSRSFAPVSRPMASGPVRTPSRSNLKRSSSYSASDSRTSLTPLGTPKKSALKSNSNHNRDMEKNRPELEGILKDYYYNENNVLVPREKAPEPKGEEPSSKDRQRGRSLSKQRTRRAGRRPSRTSIESQEAEDASLKSIPSFEEAQSEHSSTETQSSRPQNVTDGKKESVGSKDVLRIPAEANDLSTDDPYSSSDEEAHSGHSIHSRSGRRRPSKVNDGGSLSSSDDYSRELPSPGSSSEEEPTKSPSTIIQRLSSRDRISRRNGDFGGSFCFDTSDDGSTAGKETGEVQTPQHHDITSSRHSSSRELKDSSSTNRLSRDFSTSRNSSTRDRFDLTSMEDDHSQANGSFCFKTTGFGDEDDDESISLQSERTENRQDHNDSDQSVGPEAAFTASRASGSRTLIIGAPDSQTTAESRNKKVSEEEGDALSYASKGPRAAFEAVRGHRSGPSEDSTEKVQSAIAASSRDDKKYHSSFSFENPVDINEDNVSDEESIQLDELMIVNDLEPGTPSSVSVDSDRAVGSIPIAPLLSKETKDESVREAKISSEVYPVVSHRSRVKERQNALEILNQGEASKNIDIESKGPCDDAVLKDARQIQSLLPSVDAPETASASNDSGKRGQRSNSLVRRHSTEDLSSSKKWELEDTVGDLPASSQKEPASRVPPRRTQSARAPRSSSPGSSQPKSILRTPTFSSPEMRRQMEFRKQQSFKNKKSNTSKQDSIVEDANDGDAKKSVPGAVNEASKNTSKSGAYHDDEKKESSKDLADAVAETRLKIRQKYMNGDLGSDSKNPISISKTSDATMKEPELGKAGDRRTADDTSTRITDLDDAKPPQESHSHQNGQDEWKFDLSAMEETKHNIDVVPGPDKGNEILVIQEKVPEPPLEISDFDQDAERLAKREQLKAEADALQKSIQVAEKEAKAKAKAAKKAAKKEKKQKKERKKKLKESKKQKSRSSKGTTLLGESKAERPVSSQGTDARKEKLNQSFGSHGSESKKADKWDHSFSSRDTESKSGVWDHSFSSRGTESKMNNSFSSRGTESKMNNSYSSRESKSRDTSAWSFSVTSEGYGGGSNSSMSLSSDMPGLSEEKKRLLEKRREERAARLEKVKKRIRQKEKQEKEKQEAEKLKPRKIKREKNLTEEQRIEKAYSWYTRCGMPSRKRMKERIRKIDGCDITEADVDLLPWLRGGRVLDAGRAMKISQSQRNLML